MFEQLLDTSSMFSSAPDMSSYREWAGEIGNSYLNSGILPTQSLTKIARAECLTPHQIEVLAGEANKAIHQSKFASTDEKYFAADFPLADAKEAIQCLQIVDNTKVASCNMDPILPKEDFDYYGAFGVKPEELDKSAEVRGDMKVAMQKAQLFKQKLQDRAIMTKSAMQSAETKFIKQARQCLIEEPSSSARMGVLGDLYSFVKSSGSKVGNKLLAKVAYVAMKEGKLEPPSAKSAMDFLLEKRADNTAPEEWISRNMDARIVNGQHPLYITLKTIDNRLAESEKYDRDSALVDDKLRLMGQKVRAL